MQLVIIFILIFAFFVVGLTVKSSFSQSKNEKPVTSERIIGSSRAEINTMLAQIQRVASPEEKMGAMCYDMVAPAEYEEYVCARDGHKTVYNVYDGMSGHFVRDIVKIRRLVESINSLTVLAEFKLDEQRLCNICNPKIETSERYVVLITKYPDGKEFRYDRINYYDLITLENYFKKKRNDNNGIDVKLLPNDAEVIKKISGLEISLPVKEKNK